MENNLIQLNGKKKTGLMRIIFSRTGIILLLLLFAIVLFGGMLNFFADALQRLMGGVGLFNLIVIILLINSDMDSTAKLTWILIVSVTSVFGTLFYLYTKTDLGSRSVKKGYAELKEIHKNDIHQDPAVLEALEKESPETRELLYFLNKNNTFPAYQNNQITYYPLGENKWQDMLIELEKAEKFIFMEYFIVDEGIMWGTILKILKEKAEQGVEVRVLYDGTCAISLLPYSYPEKLRALGIQCEMFSPIRPFVSTHYNYRDHRKILVIDGKVGFCGGVNLADEYINQRERFGHWKDTAIRIKGSAVDSLTLMFLNMWSFGDKNAYYKKYMNQNPMVYSQESGYIIPYACNPFENNKIGERVYLDILNRAHKYVHIMTPYLILDDEMVRALKYASERGVDVKLIMPGIPDKKAVYSLAKTYFKTLIESGIEIYLYTPGFVHAKVFVSDDIKAVVGTINLDYRSLYHHFECATYMYKVSCILEIEKDFQETQALCQKVTRESIKNESIFTKATGSLVRLIAPLL